MDFLPEGEKEPEVSNYMKFEDGENRFRVLSSAVVGMEYWVEEGNKRKPVRKHMDENIPMDELGIDKWGNQEQPKYFWAFVVWNCKAERFQILEITQATVRKPIKALTTNKKWGDPKEYDIVVTKTGQEKLTEYQVTPDPKEKIDKAIETAYKATTINLEALFTGDDPFAGEVEDRNDDSAKDELKTDDESDQDAELDKLFNGEL